MQQYVLHDRKTQLSVRGDRRETVFLFARSHLFLHRTCPLPGGKADMTRYVGVLLASPPLLVM